MLFSSTRIHAHEHSKNSYQKETWTSNFARIRKWYVGVDFIANRRILERAEKLINPVHGLVAFCINLLFSRPVAISAIYSAADEYVTFHRAR